MNKKVEQTIYLDHAAATPMGEGVVAAMQSYFASQFANPSGLYRPALDARRALDDARETVARFLQTNADTVIFTSGGTASINLAILGAARAHADKGKHLITTNAEHSAVLESMRQLQREGFDVTYLPIDEAGAVTVEQIIDAVREDTILVSVMYANNEIGTIQPLHEIGKKILRYRKQNATAFPLFHSDACQATQYLGMHVERLHVDLLSLNGSKIYGPKGAGVLYRRRGVQLQPLMFGGGQEFGFVPGTEDVASIVGLAAAIEQIVENKEDEYQRIKGVRDYFWTSIQKQIDAVTLNGQAVAGDQRLPNNLNVSFGGVEAEALILYLDAAGIYVSSGSACHTDSDEVSHVLRACGFSGARCRASIRFSLGKETDTQQIDAVMAVLPDVLEKVRRMNCR